MGKMQKCILSSSLALSQYLENASFPRFHPQMKSLTVTQVTSKSSCHEFTVSKIWWACIHTWKQIGIHISDYAFDLLSTEIRSWSVESLSLFCVSLSTDSSKISEETGKAWAAWCRGRISSLGGVPPPPSLNSLSLFISFYRPHQLMLLLVWH